MKDLVFYKMVKKKVVKKMDRNNFKKKDNSILFAFLATFLLIVGFLIAVIVKRDNKYVMYYAKQSLVIFVMWVIVGIMKGILSKQISDR